MTKIRALWCLNVNMVVGFGPNLGPALWPMAKPINYDVLTMSGGLFPTTHDETVQIIH